MSFKPLQNVFCAHAEQCRGGEGPLSSLSLSVMTVVDVVVVLAP